MTQWRMKALHLSEWGELQNKFEALLIASGGNPELAMFMKSVPGADNQEIYVTGPHIDSIEAWSPGGWDDANAPSGEGISLLVGANDPWERFGIPKP